MESNDSDDQTDFSEDEDEPFIDRVLDGDVFSCEVSDISSEIGSRHPDAWFCWVPEPEEGKLREFFDNRRKPFT